MTQGIGCVRRYQTLWLQQTWALGPIARNNSSKITPVRIQKRYGATCHTAPGLLTVVNIHYESPLPQHFYWEGGGNQRDLAGARGLFFLWASGMRLPAGLCGRASLEIRPWRLSSWKEGRQAVHALLGSRVLLSLSQESANWSGSRWREKELRSTGTAIMWYDNTCELPMSQEDNSNGS